MRSFKIATYVPKEYLDEIMDIITRTIEPLHPGYDRTFSYYPVTGTWRPLEGSEPFKGTIGSIEIAEEIKLEFAVKEKDIENAVKAILSVHPYEEPAIDIIEIIDWHGM